MKADRSAGTGRRGEDRIERRLAAARMPPPSEILRSRVLAAAGAAWRSAPPAGSLLIELRRTAFALAAAAALVVGTELWTAAPVRTVYPSSVADASAPAAFPQAFVAGGRRTGPTPEEIAAYRRRLLEMIGSNPGEKLL